MNDLTDIREAEFEKARERFRHFLQFFVHTFDEKDGKVKPYPCPPRKPDYWWELKMADVMQDTSGDMESEVKRVLYIIKSRRVRRTLCLAAKFAWHLLFHKRERCAVFSLDLDRANKQNLGNTWKIINNIPWVSNVPNNAEYEESEFVPPFPINGARYFKLRWKKYHISVKAYESSHQQEKLYENWMSAMKNPEGYGLTFGAIDEAAKVKDFGELLDENLRPAHTPRRAIIVQGKVKGKNEFDRMALNENEDGEIAGKINPDQQDDAFESPEEIPDICEQGIKEWRNYRGDRCFMIKCIADPWKRPGTKWYQENVERGGERGRQEYLCDRNVTIDESKAFPQFDPVQNSYSSIEGRYEGLTSISPDLPIIRSWDPGWEGMACVIMQMYGKARVFHRSWMSKHIHPEQFVTDVVQDCAHILPDVPFIFETGDVQLQKMKQGRRKGDDWTWKEVIKDVMGDSKWYQRFKYYQLDKRPMIQRDHIPWINQLCVESTGEMPHLVVNGEDEGLVNALREPVLNIPKGKQSPRKSQPIKEYPEMHIKDCMVYAIAMSKEHPVFTGRSDLSQHLQMGRSMEQMDRNAQFEIDMGALNRG